MRATEDAPMFASNAPGVTRIFVNRAFSSWDARGSLEVTAANAVTVGIGSQFGRSAFFRWASGSIDVTYRFSAVRRNQFSTRRY